MGESVLDWRNFIVPIIVCLFCLWAGGKWFASPEKRKRTAKSFEYWKLHWQMVNPYQLAEMIERGATDYLTAYRYLLSWGISCDDAEFMLDAAITQLGTKRKRKLEKDGKNG